MKRGSRSDHQGSPPTPVVKRSDHVVARRVAAGNATASKVLLGPDDGVANFFMRKFTMTEGGGMPRHTNSVEHEQYVLAGRARIEIGTESYEVGADDVVFIPAGVEHSYRVLEAPFEFLCLVPNQPDEIELIDSTC